VSGFVSTTSYLPIVFPVIGRATLNSVGETKTTVPAISPSPVFLSTTVAPFWKFVPFTATVMSAVLGATFGIICVIDGALAANTLKFILPLLKRPATSATTG